VRRRRRAFLVALPRGCGRAVMPLRILYACSEFAPLVKTGGLGDVAGALPAALRRLGLDARVMLPGYPAVMACVDKTHGAIGIPPLARLPQARLLEAVLPGDVPAFIVDAPALYERDGGPYQDGRGIDWGDNPLRFGLLSRAAAWLGSPDATSRWRADIVHANDWQTGLAPAYGALLHHPGSPTVITIHNLAFQGVFAPHWVTDLGLPAGSFRIDGVEYYGRFAFLKAALFYANAITTVSPTYAAEIQREPLGMGLHGLLSTRSSALTGILNGIDTQAWDPRTDPVIAARYDEAHLERKQAAKRALQRELRLGQGNDLLLGVVTRLSAQKGIDLLLDVADAVLALPAGMVILGNGERPLEERVRALADAHPRKVAAVIGFDEALAHRIEAGADAFVMPSRFEPCGLNQMYSQRYGTPPIVHATGGLVDSVVDCTSATLADGTATGFKFDEPTAPALLGAIRRAAKTFRDRPAWRMLQATGMRRDFGWDAAAREYARVYARVTQR
jgi:starch synthase